MSIRLVTSNPYSEIGAVRILTQFVGYDIPLTILSLGPAFVAGSLSLAKIASAQTIPFALTIPWNFFVFSTCTSSRAGRGSF
ncbi:MAG: NADH-quinone oxidoreductase subunit H [Thermoproteota archaeon]